MFRYSDDIHRNKSIIYGVFRDNELKYAVEIKDNAIGQSYGIYNSVVSTEDMRVIKAWFLEWINKKEKE